jgi:hypothetical protein
MEHKLFWKQLKNGELRFGEKAFKGICIQEIYKQIESNQTYQHNFLRLDTGAEKTFISYCGYDRGPKHKAILNKMFQ